MKSAIIGTYNSGSSVLSQIVELLGADIGRPLWRDHFESLTMKSLLSAWWKEPEMVAVVGANNRIPFIRAWGDHYEQSTGLVCLKHPLLCLCGTDLDYAWGASYKAIRASRPIDDAIRGLKKRRWFRHKEERIQRILLEASQTYFEKKEHLDIAYYDLLQHPHKKIEEIACFLELNCTPEIIEVAASYVRKPEARMNILSKPDFK